MSIDTIYNYLEYLALAVEQLGDAVIEREEESAVAEARIAQMGDALIQAQKEIDKAEARAALAETRAYTAEVKVQDLTVALASAKASVSKAKAKDAQPDLFASSTPSSAPIAAAPARGVANDQNALILAKRLDSTIDKVQRLLAQANG